MPKTASEITIDATLDEIAWQNALILELLFEVRPGENVTPPVNTEVLLTYDSDNFYAAFRCYDPDPSAHGRHELCGHNPIQQYPYISYRYSSL